MIEDKELEQAVAEKATQPNFAEHIEEKDISDVKANEIEVVEEEQQVPTVDINKIKIETQFSKQMDVVKENVLKDAAVTDNQFVDTIKKNVKEAAVKLTEVERGKAEFQEQQIDYEKEKLETKQKKNVHEQSEDKWANRQKRRQFHYDGVKPIMEFVNIKDPMNLICLYFLTLILIIPFLIGKLIKGTFGTLVSGASDGSRSKAAKGFLWTITCIFALLVVVCLVYLFLKWQGIDLLANIRN